MAENAKLNKNGYAEKAGYIDVYCYNPVTKEYIGKRREFVSHGVSLSANSVIDAPIEPKDGYAIVRNETTGKWEYVPDNRNTTVYNKETREQSTITYLGEVKDTYTSTPPTTLFDKWDGIEWVVDEQAEKEYNITVAKESIKELMAEATIIIDPLKDKVEFKTITTEEKAKLKAWKEYRIALSDLDVNEAPNIEYPIKPN